MKVSIVGPGIAVSTEAPVESADAIQRDALEVRVHHPDEDEPATADFAVRMIRRLLARAAQR